MQREETDAALVQNVLAGDHGAFTHLVQKYRKPVFGMALSYAHTPQDAEDIAQEAFVKAYFGLSRLRDPGKFGAWLYRIAHCFAASWYRRKDQQLLYVDDMELIQPVVSDRCSDDWLAVKDALNQLPEDLRVVLVLRYVADWPTRKISTFLGAPIGTVESRLSRARTRLRGVLQVVEDHLNKQNVSDQFTQNVQSLVEKGLAILQETYELMDHGEKQQNEVSLAKAATLLWQAYQMGAKEPRVVWPLRKLWTDTGHLALVIRLLKDYLEVADEPEEKFQAAVYVVLAFAMSSSVEGTQASRLAVEHHQRYISELGKQVPAWRVLWSLSIGDIASAWRISGKLDDWLTISHSIYENVKPVDDESRLQIAYYLRTLCSMEEGKGRLDDAVAHALELQELYADLETPDAFRLTVDALGQLHRLYGKAGKQGLKDSTEKRLETMPDQLEMVLERVSGNPMLTVLAKEYRHISYTLCHNIGCIFRWDHQPRKAANFFARALTYRDSPLGHYFYAGVLLEGYNDRAGALLHLEKALADPRSSLIHRIEVMFKDDRYFTSVHDDPEFQRIVQAVTERYRSVGVGA